MSGTTVDRSLLALAAGGSIVGNVYSGYQQRKESKKVQQTIEQETKRVQEAARKRELELANRMSTEKARKRAVRKRSSLLTEQRAARSKASPRGGTILTKRNPFGQSLIGSSSMVGQ